MERNVQVQRDMPSGDLALKRTPYIRERMTACRSMLWCNTQIPNCNHRVNSQTRENIFSTFQNFTISRTLHSASFSKRGKTKLACEQQTHFRSSLLSLRERSDDRKCVCCSQARQNGSGFLCGVVVASSAAGNLLQWPWGVWAREEEKKNLWWSCHLCSSPFSPHSLTLSLKQDSDVCGGG